MLNKTYSEVIAIADKKILARQDFSVARYLMRELCENSGIDLYANLDNFIDEAINETFQAAVIRLLDNEPVAYILGYSWFFGRKFKVNADVLIPRTETEQLVLNALLEIEDYFQHFDLKLLDLGCGSGAIGTTLKLEEPALEVSLSDVSSKALEVAKANAAKLNAKVDFILSDILEVFIKDKEKFDIIISNPPYILDDETVDSSVIDYEPHLALFGGADGLDFYQKILKQSQTVLNHPGMLGFEIGYNQREALIKEVKAIYPKAVIKTFKDFADLDRMVFVYV